MASNTQVEAAAQPGAAAAGAAAAGDVNQANQAPRQSGWEVFQSIVSRILMFYLMMQAMNYFKAKPVGQTGDNKFSPSVDSAFQPGNMFPKGTLFDMNIYISEEEAFTKLQDSKALFWSLKDIEYGNWYGGPNSDGEYTYSGQIELTPYMQNNGTIYCHVYFAEKLPEVIYDDFDSEKPSVSKRTPRSFSAFKRLNKYSKRIYKTTKNLLTGATDKDEDYQLKAKDNLVEILSFWHPNLTINLVDDHSPWQPNSVPPPLNEHVTFDKSGKYYPVIFMNDYWNLHADYQPINSTLSKLNLTLTFSHLQLWKWQLYLSQTMRSQQWYNNMLQDDASDEDQDTIKRTLMDTNPYLLAMTVVITLVHNVFEFLAFKNDIQFWRNRKSLEGLSVNSVLFGCFTSLIVLLYVLDNDTNTVVKISVGIGLLIDLWKVPKVINITFDYEHKYFGLIPKVIIIHKASYVESNTNDHDKLAFKYLSWALFPLVVCYAIYSLIYNEHKSWYSWMLSMVYGFLLTFGFIMMTPQLFINYKLKSVAHLPWRMMTYKALNTFIDDIFAFVIKMPTLYRIGCFRDDIIFFIYLYQRWIYPVDKKRTNEFGTSGDDTPQQGNDSGSNETSAPPAAIENVPSANAHVKSD